MNKKLNFLLAILISLVIIAPLSSFAVKPSDFGLKEGDVISATGDPDVYIINDFGYKRLFVNPEIFNLYGHLSWDKIKKVSPATRDAFITSGLFRNCELNDPKVYGLEVISEDVANLRWVNTSGEQAVADDPDFFKKVFCINNKEFNLYNKGPQYSSVKDIPEYKRGALSSTPTPTPTSSASSTPTPTPSTPGVLSVTLASDNPSASSVPIGVMGVPFLKFNVSGIQTINEVVISRSGMGLAEDFDAVYLYDGARRLTSAKTFDSDTNKVTFINLDLAVGSGKTLTVKADIKNSINIVSRQDAFSVASINGTSVSGVSGNLMTYANVPAATAVITNTSTSWSVAMNSTGVELAKFSIQESGGASDLIVRAITLRHNGTLDSSLIKNLKLKVGSTELASCPALVLDKAVFSFSTPYTISRGQTKNFVVYGDITGGRTNETIQFYVEEKSDLDAADASYGYGSILVNNWDQSSAAKTQTVTISGAQVTLNFNGPVSSRYAQSSTGNEFLNFSIYSGKTLTVKKIKVNIVIKSGGVGVAQDNVNYSRLKNIKIVDASSGTTVVGPLSSASSGTTWSGSTSSGYYKVFDDQFTITGGVARNLSLRADIDALFASDLTIEMGVDFSGSNYIFDSDSGQYVLPGNIAPNTLTGNRMTIAAASLSVVKASTPSSTTVVKGAQNVEGLGIILNAGIGDTITLSKLSVRVYGDSDGVFNNSGYGDTPANTIVQTVSLYDDTGNLIGGPANLSLAGSYCKADLSGLDYKITAGAQKKLIIKANLLSSFSGTRYIAFDVLPSSDIEAFDSRENSIDFSSQNNNLNLSESPNPKITCSQAGTLAVSVDPSSPAEGIVAAGEKGVVFAKYKFSTTNEAMIIRGLKLVNSNADYDRNFSRVILSYKNSKGNEEEKVGSFGNGSLVFTDGQLEIYVPKDDSATLTIKADINSISSGARSGDTPKITLAASGGKLTDEFIAEGVSSSNKVYGASNNIPIDNTNIAQMIIRKSKPVLTTINLDSALLSAGEKTFYKWSVEAASGFGDVSWKLVTFNITGMLGNGSSLLTIGSDDEAAPAYDGIYTIVNGNGGAAADTRSIDSLKIYKGTSQINGTFYYRSRVTANDVGGYYVVFVPDAEQQIGSGGKETYELRGNFSIAPTNSSGTLGNINIKIADLSSAPTTNTFDNVALSNDANSITSDASAIPTVSFVWSDNSAPTHSVTTSDWANDYKVSGIPTSTWTMTR